MVLFDEENVKQLNKLKFCSRFFFSPTFIEPKSYHSTSKSEIGYGSMSQAIAVPTQTCLIQIPNADLTANDTMVS